MRFGMVAGEASGDLLAGLLLGGLRARWPELMTQGIGTRLTADEKRAHLTDIRRAHLIDEILKPEILPPERRS